MRRVNNEFIRGVVVEVNLVRTEKQAAQVRILAWEFIGWMRERYPEMLDEIEDYLTAQNFEQQLDGLLTYFNPPQGECLFAPKRAEKVSQGRCVMG